MKNKGKWIGCFLISVWLVLGCNAVTGTGPVYPPPTIAPKNIPTLTQTPRGVSGAPTQTALPTKDISGGPNSTALPPLEENWDNREVYKRGLIKEQQAAADQLTGASVYHVDVRIADDYLSLQGSESVRYTNRESAALDVVYFQLFPNMEGGETSLNTVTVNGKSADYKFEFDDASLAVAMPGGLAPGQSALISLDFRVSIPTSTKGNYGLFGYIDNILALDGFYPAIPVYDSQGWHAGQVPENSDTTFQDASFYWVRVTAPKQLVMAASGVEVERQKTGALQVVTYAAGPARDFYLVGSEQFRKTSVTVGETVVNSYALVGLEGHAKKAMDTAVKALTGYIKRVGPYAYTEFDVVSTPMDGALGIEYPGIVGINKDMYDPSQPFTRMEATVAHEVGHQWFYNMIGNDQINDPWLDEALTQYITGSYYLDRYGKDSFNTYRESWARRWSNISNKLMPIGLPAARYAPEEYSGIVYGRGPLFVEALAQQMGQSVFEDFLRDYFKTNEWGVVTPAQFKHSAEEHCKCDLSKLFAEWVNP